MSNVIMKFRKLEDVLLSILITMMMVAPTSYMVIKLGIILVLQLFNVLNHRYKCQAYSKVFYGIIGLILLGGIWTFCNVVLKASLSSEELLKMTPFLLLWPLLYVAMIPYLSGEHRQYECIKLLAICHTVIVLFNLYNVVALLYGMEPIQIDEENDSFRYDDHFIGVATNSMHCLVYTTPFFFIIGFSEKISKKWFYPVACLTLGFNFVSSRTLLAIVNILSIGLAYVVSYKFYEIKRRSINLFVVTIVLVSSIYLVPKIDRVYIESTIEYYLMHFDSSDDIRFEQRQILIDKWVEKPITGHGVGTKFKTNARGLSNEFESTYHAMLANNGLIGFGIFFFYISLIFVNVYKRAKNENNIFFIACLSSLAVFLIGAYSNPLIGTFDRLFPIYLSLACLYVRPSYSLENHKI